MKLQTRANFTEISIFAGSAAAASAILFVAPPSLAAQLTSWTFNPDNKQLEIAFSGNAIPQYSLLAKPYRIVVDLPNTKLGIVPRQRFYTGAISQVQAVQYKPNVTRLILVLSPEVVVTPAQIQLRQVDSAPALNRWVLRPLIFGDPNPNYTAAEPLPASIAPSRVPATAVPAAPASNRPIAIAPSVTLPPTNTSVQLPLPSPQRPAPQPRTLPSFTNPQIQTGNFSTYQVPNTGFPERSPAIAPTPSAPASPNRTIIYGDPLRPGAQIPYRQQPLNPGVQLPYRQQPLSSGAMRSPYGLETTLPPTSATPRLLSAGAKLNLRYPGENALTLKAGETRQEVLLLADDLRDATGNPIAAAGTPVIGTFETDGGSSRFVAQAIALNNSTNLPLAAQSEPIGGTRQVSDTQLIGNSALGALGVVLLGGFSGGLGLLGGAALGAAATYATAPEAIAIQPGQILSVQLTSDLANTTLGSSY